MIEIFVLVFIAITLYCYWKTRRPNNFPPGPTPTPFLGNMNDMPKEGHLFQAVDAWSKKYGPIIGINILDSRFVFITGADTVLAALRKDDFQSRPDNFSLRDRSFGKCLGIFMSSGEQWASSRKFVVKQLRVFGKNEKENLIADEIAQLMETLKDGSTIQGNGLFGLSAVNVIWMMIANRRLDVNDEKSQQFLKNLTILFRSGSPSGFDIVNLFPFLRFFISRYKISKQIITETQEFIRAAINDHREVLDPNNPMDLIDHYLLEIEKNKEQSSLFTEEDLITIGLDMFTAGAESTSNSVEFVLLYMILYPEVQKRLHEELDRVLGRSRKPVLDDKAEMHYTMAVLTEVERCNTIAPTSVMHNTIRDTTFGGHFIPKDTLISLNMWALGHDPKYWKNPDEFNPDRFMSPEGKFMKSPVFLPFGLGQRVCVGEVMARNSIFLFVTTFLEKYSVSLPPGEPKPSTLALPGFTTAPRPFKITINSRY